MTCRPLAYSTYRPARIGNCGTLVVIHGKRGNATQIISDFKRLADRLGVILVAPDFSSKDWRGYQWLAGSEGPLTAMRAFDALLQSLPAEILLPGAPINLFGFSGGAQFAHRFALLRPERVARLIVAAAGWYTELDPDRCFPEGLAAASVDQKSRDFLSLPIHVAVGAKDTRRSTNLRTIGGLDDRQGRNRLERARFWVEHLRRSAVAENLPPNPSLTILPHCAHNLHAALTKGGLEAVVASAISPNPEIAWKDGGGVEPADAFCLAGVSP